MGTTYLHQHELVKAAVHHQPQGAGRRLSAGALPASSLRLLPLLLFLRLLTLPLETPLLFPVLPFLPARSELKVCETSFAAHEETKKTESTEVKHTAFISGVQLRFKLFFLLLSNPNVKSKISRTKDGSTQSTVKRCCLNEPELTYFRSSLSSSHFCCFRSFFICLLDRFCFAAGASGWRISVSSSGPGSPRLLSAMVSASLRFVS